MTLARMQELVRASLSSAVVRQRAAVLRGATARDTAENIERFLQLGFIFRHDPTNMELLHAPQVLLAQWEQRGYMVGDCDDAAILAAALARASGLRVRFRVAGWHADGPLTHVYAVLQIGAHEWMALDVTHLPTIPAQARRQIEVDA